VRILYFFVAVLIGLAAVSASAFKEGPYPNVTGGFGEQSCHLCHLDNPMNDAGGSVQVAGVPPTFRKAAGSRLRRGSHRDGDGAGRPGRGRSATRGRN
jgi:hypothetical protein